MPSHALDDPAESRARRRAAGRLQRRRNVRDWRHAVPAALVLVSIMGVTGQPSFRGGAMGLMAGLVRMVLLDALSARRDGPTPRWQYLLGAAGWLAVAAFLVLAGRDIGHAWLARACVALGGWGALCGLVLLGRAASWGRARTVFWWNRPSWAIPGPPTPPADPV